LRRAAELSVFLWLCCAAVWARDLGHREATLWTPFVEWNIENPAVTGSPYDLDATVTFTHQKSEDSLETGMFFDGGTTWKFRFTGTRLGLWRFSTRSGDSDLDGHTGTVTVEANPDPKIRGFLTHQGNRYAIQTRDGNLQAYLFNVYMGRVNHDAFVGTFGPEPAAVRKKTRACLEEAFQNGFEVIFVTVNNSWFRYGAQRHDEHESREPDRTTFRVLEEIITTVHKEGGRVHFWAWGDESRKWTPRGAGGINGPADRRVQRGLAARLGPLPGWTLGYGFDLHEWTRPEELASWAEYVHDHLGWQHLLSARGAPLPGRNNINSYDGFGRGVSLATTRGGPLGYQEIVEDLSGDTSRPHLYEERHSYLRPGFQLDMDGTRRLLWWEAVAGGMGGFFGFYPTSPHPYPKPEQLRTHREFWHGQGRFLLTMKRAEDLADGDTRVLAARDEGCYVLYREDTRRIALGPGALRGSRRAVAVDTKQEYGEVDLGILDEQAREIRLPHRSDWAVAVGDFPGRSDP
jgi:hypothetical protein